MNLQSLHSFCFFLLSVVGSIGGEPITTDYFDLVELNHFYDDQGKLIFTQLIYYDWNPVLGNHIIQGWRMLPRLADPQGSFIRAGMLPKYHAANKEYISIWNDRQSAWSLRKVVAYSYRETHTQFDPELEGRVLSPVPKRRGFSLPLLPINKDKYDSIK